MKKTINWEIVNAYVDRELSPADMAAVARAIMLDRHLAAQVAQLTRLKAVTSELPGCGHPDIDLDSFDPPARQHARWYARAAALFIIPVAAALLSGLFSTQNTSTSAIAQATAIHQQWLNTLQANDTAGTATGELLQANLQALQSDAYTPDLSKANLFFAGIHPVTITTEKTHRKGIHIGYRGNNGCMVSLIVENYEENDFTSLQPVTQRSHTAYRWRVRHSGYYLLASRMDPHRLQKLAQIIYQMTVTHTPLDDASILALNQAKAEGMPCTA